MSDPMFNLRSEPLGKRGKRERSRSDRLGRDFEVEAGSSVRLRAVEHGEVVHPGHWPGLCDLAGSEGLRIFRGDQVDYVQRDILGCA